MTKKIHTRKIFPAVLLRTAVLLLMMAGVNQAWGEDLVMPCYKSGAALTSIFTGGETVLGTNVTNVLRVKNTTATASFGTAHTLLPNEQVTLSFTAYHGFLLNNKTSKVAIYNSEGQELISYTYDHTSRNISDVQIGGSTATGFAAFSGTSYRSNSETDYANGLGGNGRPYIADSDYNPNISLIVKGNGTAQFTFWREKGNPSNLWQDFNGSLGSLKVNIKEIRITDNCDNDDRAICIDNLYLRTSYYSNDYESNNTDWTTSTSGRFTPVILEEVDNHYLSVKQDERDNNGATLSSPSLGVPAGTSYQMTFDLKVSSSTDKLPTAFKLYDAANTGTIFSLTATDKSVDTWKVNDGDIITLPGTNIGNGDITTVPWYSITILRAGTNTWVTIKKKSDNSTVLNNASVTASATGGLGKMQFETSRYYANFAIDNVVVTPVLGWSESAKSIDILEVGNTNPNRFADLPAITVRNYAVSTYASSNTNVANFPSSGVNSMLIKGIGTTTITATDVNGYTAAYTLTVTGSATAPVVTANSLTFGTEGLLINNTESTAGSYTLSGSDLNIAFGYSGETALVVNEGIGPVLKVIDSNGYSHPNLTGGVIPPEDQWGGTYVKLTTTKGGHLVVTGNIDSERSKFYKSDGTSVPVTLGSNTLTATLNDNSTYYLYNTTTAADETANSYVPMVGSISFKDAYFEVESEVIEIPASGQYTIKTPVGMSSPTYTIVCYGDIGSAAVSGNTITGITGGGAIKITATSGASSTYYILTVAYPASSGHKWTFNMGDEEHLITSSNLQGKEPTPLSTITDDNGDNWTAHYKNPETNNTPEWRLDRSVDGDNVIIVNETAGLLFHTGTSGFYMNDYKTSARTSYKHIGICGNASSFTIPYLKAGDIVELNWRHFTDESGSSFSATNLKDLRNKVIDETFKITKSQDANQRGWYSFEVVADGDVTFTLMDGGYTDILSVRIYEGPYVPTMGIIKDSDGKNNAATQMLLDNAVQTMDYGICQAVNSTGTGPAYCVLKGWDNAHDYYGSDKTECIGGYNSSRDNPVFFIDENAYPVTDAEKTQLYELRKNLVGFRMYNTIGKSTNNSYNYAHISAISGWGKVTIRMNNYTNDMKYLIGYTPDYTLTIGSKPHQNYPYTWDFMHISAQKVTGESTNIYNSIKQDSGSDEYYDEYATNWEELTTAKYALKTNNSEPLSSQYVPGAVLVTTNRALSNFNGALSSKYALDEFDGLGFEGQIVFGADASTKTSARSASLTRAGEVVSLLSMQVDDYMNKTFDGEGTVTGGTFKYSENDELVAGNGKVAFGANKFETSSVASCGFGYKSDGNVSTTKYVKLTPSRPFQAGDVISLKAYATSNPNGSNYGLALYTAASGGLVTTLYLGAKQKNVEVTLNYTVTAGDGLEGQTSVYVFRAPENSTYITEAEITGEPAALNASMIKRAVYCAEDVTITIPDLNADSKQDWIYISSSAKPTTVTNATEVTEGADGPDANQKPELEDNNAHVYKYKVTNPDNAYITFAAGTKIYKIGVTHILKEMHPVGGIGWATEIRKHSIDHTLTGYFTKNDANAYTVAYDSYDMNTATVALTPINEDGYVPDRTGIVMRLDNASGLTDANAGKNVPLFYPSYTRPQTSTAVDFPANNLMYNVEEGIDNDKRNDNERINVSGADYTKFILTNIHWTYDLSHTLNADEASTAISETDAAGFYRMHIWKTTEEADVAAKNTMPKNSAYLLVPTEELPIAVWDMQQGASSGARQNTLGIRYSNGQSTSIEDVDTKAYQAVDKGTASDSGETWYTLSGIRLARRPSKEGLYICNGRKVLIKQ